MPSRPSRGAPRRRALLAASLLALATAARAGDRLELAPTRRPPSSRVTVHVGAAAREAWPSLRVARAAELEPPPRVPSLLAPPPPLQAAALPSPPAVPRALAAATLAERVAAPRPRPLADLGGILSIPSHHAGFVTN